MADQVRDPRWEDVYAFVKSVKLVGAPYKEFYIGLRLNGELIGCRIFISEEELKWSVFDIYKMTLDVMVEEIDKELLKRA